MLGAVALSLASVGAANPARPVIEKFLASNPSLHLLQLAEVRDIVDPAFEKFSPFVQMDLTGDRILDSRSGFGPRQWVVRLQPERIVGLYVGDRRRIDIAYGVECDSNAFVRWDGTEYAEDFWVPGDSPATFDQPSKGSRPVGLRVSLSETVRQGELTEVREGFVIGGWIARWRLLEVFLDDWWPILGEAPARPSRRYAGPD